MFVSLVLLGEAASAKIKEIAAEQKFAAITTR